MAMNATTPGLPPDLHGALVNIQNSFGVVLIGSAASTGLLGVTTLQAWFYFRSYPEDNLLTKLMVSVVWCIEFIRSSFLVRAAYFYLVLNWGNIAVLNENNWSINILPLMTNLGELFGHLYFAWRIYTLARVPVVRWILTGLVATLSVWNFGMGTATYVITSRAASLTSFGNSGSQKILSPFALATAISTDVAIMVSLIFLLNRGRTGLSRTDHLINMLIYYTVQAGMITVVADVVIIILNHYIDRVGFTYLGPYAIVGNLYANSFLARYVSSLCLSDRRSIH
ncbi:hypothetical protein BC629DRAFT_1096950 [Irpex lacteus]|nr:hypothetical protein BC629DRAFT_1096950 [Irpex lacteus]